MRIAVDALGGDFGAEPNVTGAIRAVRNNPELTVLLTGKEEVIRAELARLDLTGIKNRLEIIHAPDVIGMDDEPVSACREKPLSSLVRCAELVKEKNADSFVSAGNSGAVMVAAFIKLGRLKGVSRPAIAAPIPTLKGYCLLLDAGANSECKPQQLLEFAAMGIVYAKAVFGVADPTVGILSMGEEECKGNSLVKDTIPLLKESGLNYKGPVEGRDIPEGTVDVVVCDGFTGNVVLKACEGLSKTLFTLIREEVKSRPLSIAGMFLAQPAFKAIRDRTNPDNVGGAPLLGVAGNVIIAHGKSGPLAMYNAINTAAMLARRNAGEEMKTVIADIKSRQKNQTPEPENEII
ncbi:MAG: phosphate acyltransferase PlsX [Elusimicrobiaceae bacterium]|nr:phosphate acyltransferase PlsX [Elusimicrobiaceae bacterium]